VDQDLDYGSNVMKMPIAMIPPKTSIASTSERISLIAVTSLRHRRLWNRYHGPTRLKVYTHKCIPLQTMDRARRRGDP
jgi:hypothetical protein